MIYVNDLSNNTSHSPLPPSLPTSVLPRQKRLEKVCENYKNKKHIVSLIIIPS